MNKANLIERVAVREELVRRRHLRAMQEGIDGIPAPYYWTLNLTQTYDEHWKDKGLDSPYQHFPEKPYFPWLFGAFVKCRRLFVPKSREMMISWAVMAYAVWHCQVVERTRVVVQCQKDEKAADLVGSEPGGYARTLYEQQPDWLRARFPLLGEIKQNRMAWANGSLIHGVPPGADQVRQYHPTIFLVDEAAYVEDFEGSYGAAIPVCQQIIAVSSAAPGYFFDVVENTLGQS